MSKKMRPKYVCPCMTRLKIVSAQKKDKFMMIHLPTKTDSGDAQCFVDERI